MVENLIPDYLRKISEEDSKFKIILHRLKSKKFKRTLCKEIHDLNEEFCSFVFEILG